MSIGFLFEIIFVQLFSNPHAIAARSTKTDPKLNDNELISNVNIILDINIKIINNNKQFYNYFFYLFDILMKITI